MDGWSRQPRAEPRLSLPLTPSTNGIRRTPFDVEKASSASRHSTGMGILSRDAFSRISWPWRSPSRSTGRRPSQTYMDVAETQYISQCSTGSLAAMLTEPLYIIYYALTATYYRLLIHACIVSLANYPRAYISMYVRRDQPRPRPKIKKNAHRRRLGRPMSEPCPRRAMARERPKKEPYQAWNFRLHPLSMYHHLIWYLLISARPLSNSTDSPLVRNVSPLTHIRTRLILSSNVR